MDIFEQDFEEMLAKYQASLNDKKKFTALVKDLFPDQAKNVNLLLMAYNMGIAQDIQTASYINNTFAFRYVKQLIVVIMPRIFIRICLSSTQRKMPFLIRILYSFLIS